MHTPIGFIRSSLIVFWWNKNRYLYFSLVISNGRGTLSTGRWNIWTWIKIHTIDIKRIHGMIRWNCRVAMLQIYFEIAMCFLQKRGLNQILIMKQKFYIYICFFFLTNFNLYRIIIHFVVSFNRIINNFEGEIYSNKIRIDRTISENIFFKAWNKQSQNKDKENGIYKKEKKTEKKICVYI